MSNHREYLLKLLQAEFLKIDKLLKELDLKLPEKEV